MNNSNSTRRDFIRKTGLGAAAMALGGCKNGFQNRDVKGARAKHPNVILIMTDDQGYGDLGLHGNDKINTPHLDRLGRNSVRLTDFHVNPTCAPTRAALLSGKYAHRVGVWNTIMSRSFLAAGETTMADVFRSNGYATGIFGKWHLGGNYPFRPIDRGFEAWVGHGDAGTGTTSDYWGNDKMNDTYLRNGRWEKFAGFCNDIYTDETISFIEKNKDRPFFAFLSTNLPHSPWHVLPQWASGYMEAGINPHRSCFYASITHVDRNIGRLRNFLDTHGLAENTVIVFLTDNGTAGGARTDENEFVIEGYNAGLRGRKARIYEGGHRVPCFIHWPGGGLRGGVEIPHLSAHVDLLPTLIDLCGLEPPDAEFDGMSLKPLLKNPRHNWPSRTMFVESQQPFEPKKWSNSAMMTERWRLVNGKELYDIKKDHAQKHDVADEHPSVVKKLRAEYEKIWADVSAGDDELNRPVVGTDRQKETWLTGDNWIPTVGWNPWDQRKHILKGPAWNGYWGIQVARDGRYEFELRRWPREVDMPITAPLDAQQTGDIHEPTKDGLKPVKMEPGEAIKADTARMKVAGAEMKKHIAPGDRAVSFRVDLKAGPTNIHTWFEDKQAGESRGAYYVYVRKIK